MYGKIFKQLWTGSMCGAGIVQQATFIWMIANANRDGLVEVNPRLLAFQFGDVKESQIDYALRVLAEPDEESRTPDHDGRRIEFVDGFTWRILNYEYYRDLRSAEARREYKREWMREKRASTAELSDEAIASAFGELWAQLLEWTRFEPPYLTRPQRKPCFDKFERYARKVKSAALAREYFRAGLEAYARTLAEERASGHKLRAAKNSRTIFNEIYRGEWDAAEASGLPVPNAEVA